ncbi:MAG TPA: hypothetical protein PKA66_05480 [Gemmatimonadales bacterium]|nr:hypothetical protein [Gemmatimonadales bacterium]
MLREVRLRQEYADEFPDVVPGRWYTAAMLAGLVKGHRLVEEGLDIELPDRLLDPERFEFRGGGPRHGGWLGARTRRVDRLKERNRQPA